MDSCPHEKRNNRNIVRNLLTLWDLAQRLRLGDVAVFEKPQLKYSTKADRSTSVDILPSATIPD
jgi:hypothetical protein